LLPALVGNTADVSTALENRVFDLPEPLELAFGSHHSYSSTRSFFTRCPIISEATQPAVIDKVTR
jgi:hypothetical protein